MQARVLRHMSVLAAIPLLAACGASGTAPVRSASSNPPPAYKHKPALVPPTRPEPPPSTGFRAAPVMKLPGLEGVIGANAQALQREFGLARLDVWEGDARKLQFSGEACVLDVYLYPSAPGREPTATYVDARRASDGLDVDRAACVAALKKR